MASVPEPVAFVLPGGATWGAVQVGMLRALIEAGIRPDFLVGTSVGALNAAVFAARPDHRGVADLASMWVEARRGQIFPLSPLALARWAAGRQRHVLDGSGLRRWVRRHVPFERLEEAPVPLHVMATDVEHGGPVMLSSGDAVTALVASCAIPGVFPPVAVGGRLLADGGASADRPVPQAIGLGARTVYQLSTYGRAPDHVRTWRGRALDTLDRRFGRPAGASPLAPPPAGGAGGGPPGRGPAPAMVHVLPAPPTTDLNPFSFRHSRPLMERAAELTAAWLGARDTRSGTAAG